MRLKKKYRNLLKFMAVTLILILTISVVAAAKQHIDNKKSNHNQDIEEDYPDEDAEAYELPERTLNSDVIPYDGVPRTISCWGDSMMFGMGAGEAYIVFGDRRIKMEVTEKITLDMLTKEGVSVLRQKFININDVEVQVGGNVRNAFTNCEDDRKILKEQLSEDYYNAVMAVWGL